MAPPLRQVHASRSETTAARVRLGLSEVLVALGVAPETLDQAAQLARRHQRLLADVLVAEGLVSEDTLAAAYGVIYRVRPIDLSTAPPDPRLIDAFGLELCQTERILPWRRIGGRIVLAVSNPERVADLLPWLEDAHGPILIALAREGQILDRLLLAKGQTLVTAAETRLAEAHSCRTWTAPVLGRVALVCLALVAIALVTAPVGLMAVMLGLALLALFAMTALRLTALVLWAFGRPQKPAPTEIAHLPRITLLVPLFEERQIAANLLRRLEALDYPRALIEALLIVEADDTTTRATLAETGLAPWMRVIQVPKGSIQTKPRALNLALGFSHGEVIGVYDAEDAPHPGQLREVARRMRQAGPELACLQGVLDYYNPCINWLSRCFTIDYAVWFRLILPTLQRLGWVMPLGGTTVFVRRAALEKAGAWDAHNVTEDADLGLRLARMGYRTEMMESVTEEEANCHLWPWIRQRARWIKGYAVTYGVHMRRPRTLWRDLGAWRFLGVQVLFAGSLLQVIMAPVLWTFWLAFIGLAHPLTSLAPSWTVSVALACLGAEAISIACGIVALSAERHRALRRWIPALHPYAMLASIAAWKAVVELVCRPFHWDKTTHGLYDPPPTPPPRQA